MRCGRDETGMDHDTTRPSLDLHHTLDSAGCASRVPHHKYPSSPSNHCYSLLVTVIDQVFSCLSSNLSFHYLSFKTRSGYRLFHSLFSP